jgi:hypothetical protein
MEYFFPRCKISAGEINILPEALIQLLIARIKTSLLPSRKYLSNCLLKKNHGVQTKNYHDVASAINRLSTWTPWKSTCLVKVLAAHQMLKRRKISHTLHFGVKQKNPVEIEAHAWLSINGKIIINGENSSEYVEVEPVSEA